MYQSILVPLDGSEFAEQALPAAISLAKQSGGTIDLLKVHVPMGAVHAEGAIFFDKEMDEFGKKQDKAYLDLIAKRIKAKFPDLNMGARLQEGEIVPAIISEAKKRPYDLVVMTTHGRGAIGRVFLGSVADHLVRDLSAPILLIRPADGKVDLAADMPFKQILIPLDGGELAEQIIEPAVALARAGEAEYTLTRVITPVLPRDYPPEIASVLYNVEAVLERVEEIHKKIREKAEDYLEKTAEKMRSRGLAVKTHLDEDVQPAAAILRNVEESPFDVIAIATYARHGLSRLFLGSVANKLIRSSPIPVLIQRPTQKASK